MSKSEKPRLKTIMWRLLQSRKVVTYDDLQELAGVSRSYAQEWMSTLIKREIVRKLSKGRFQLMGDIYPELEIANKTIHLKFKNLPRNLTPLKTDEIPETILWRAILKLRKFCMADLYEKNLANKTTAQQYVTALVKAGFLKKDIKRRLYNRCFYRLGKVTGNKAPLIGRALYLYDPNTDKIWDNIPVSRKIKKHLTR